ncbi:hypothetical protein [Agreia sp. COWG]|uniref:hypothetical protein n=1 Tax=Agreia sp. COWG TaxID=2773266 RepID=UPI00192636EA|nr:hypothetical protein [Agreia sp. COWG]CAD6009880.1 conserved protein of unknown function [Agreia sp. COWG]
MMAAGIPALVVTHDAQHGVTQYSQLVASAVERLIGVRARVSSSELAHPSALTHSHLHFTDRLWGASPEEAAARIESIAARTSITVTLHDLPQHSDGAANFARRADCYRRVLAAAQGVVCNSVHELDVLKEFVDEAARAHVIPLPIDAEPLAAVRPVGDGNIAVLGFYYPGKGHIDVVRAAARIARTTSLRAGVVVLGRASIGHEGDLDRLARTAARLCVPFEVTGYLDDAELFERTRRASVAVAAHRHFSASGSINTWIASGRRPLVVDGRYTREVAGLRPGTVTLVDGTEALPGAIAAALAEPDSTWLPADAVMGPNAADVASAYVSWWRGMEW